MLVWFEDILLGCNEKQSRWSQGQQVHPKGRKVHPVQSLSKVLLWWDASVFCRPAKYFHFTVANPLLFLPQENYSHPTFPHPTWTNSEVKSIEGADFSDTPFRQDQINYLCGIAKGTNPTTKVSTRDSLGCPEWAKCEVLEVSPLGWGGKKTTAVKNHQRPHECSRKKRILMILVGFMRDLKWIFELVTIYMAVSENGGTPKWMVYKGKPY